MHENDLKNQPVRETATVTVSDTVDGTKKRRSYTKRSKKAFTTTLALSDCDPGVAAAAESVRKPGQLLRIISRTEIQVVNA